MRPRPTPTDYQLLDSDAKNDGGQRTEIHITSTVRSPTHDVTLPALFAALLAASAWISIPIGAVPLTLQVFIVLLAGLTLRPSRAAAAVGAYLLLGAAGVPVFAGAQGGLGVLMGPTGGFLSGFLAAAVVMAEIRYGVARVGWKQGPVVDIAAVVSGIVVIYAMGWVQLAIVTGMGAGAAFVAGVAPFIALDAAKGVGAILVAVTLRRAGLVGVASYGSPAEPSKATS